MFIRAASLAVLTLMLGPAALAQSGPQTPMSNPPLTSDGKPDLQGLWTNQSLTTLVRNAKIPNLVLSPKEAADLEAKAPWNVNTEAQRGPTDDSKPHPVLGQTGGGVNAFWMDVGRHYATVKGEIRSSWITEPANGQLPLKPTAEASQKDPAVGNRFGTFDGPETRPLSERCIVFGGKGGMAGPVMQNSGYNNNFRFVQTPQYVLIEAEMIHDVRIIPLVADRNAAKHRSDGITPWYGDSVAWYEGNSLVIETTGMNARQQGLMSPAGKSIERLTRWSDNEILYEFEIDDPTLYTQPWKGEEIFLKSPHEMYEYACHEGNYALADILSGARVMEAQGKVLQNISQGE